MARPQTDLGDARAAGRPDGRAGGRPDGRVIVVGEVPDPYRGGERSLKVSIFMNVFNVHSQRAPVTGTILRQDYSKGLFVNAAFDKASR